MYSDGLKIFYGLIIVVLILTSAVMLKVTITGDIQKITEWVLIESVDITAVRYGEDVNSNSTGADILTGEFIVGAKTGVCYYTTKTDDGGFKTKKVDLLNSIYYEDNENPRLEVWALVYKDKKASDFDIFTAEKQYRFYVPKEVIQDNFNLYNKNKEASVNA